MTPEEKIERLVSEDRIFLKADGTKYAYYVVKGTSKKIYEVIYDKLEDKFHCTCDNVRLTPCYHIKAVQRYMLYLND